MFGSICWHSITLLFLVIFFVLGITARHPDVFLTLEERVKRHGYPLERHQVTTEDGYILSSYRIPHGHSEHKDMKNKSVVILLHGMGGTPNYWVTLGAKDALAYYLADRGFDVWMLQARGVAGSVENSHVKWDWNKDNEYWLFSLHEIAVYDLRTNIDYVTALTNQSKVFFIGHSAGAPELLVLLSERPEYNDKVKIGAFYASSPIIKRMDYPFVQLLCSLSHLWRGLARLLNMTEALPQLAILKPILKLGCSDPMLVKICIAVSGVIGSHASVLIEEELYGVMASDQPQRISIWQYFQFLDNISEGDFKQLNHGPKENMKIYGQESPPRYNISRCKVPVAFFYAPSDSICGKSDIYESMNYLPNVVLDYEVPFKKFNHIDFLFARNATNLVYEPTYQLFKDFDEGRLPQVVGKKIIPKDDFPRVF